MSWTINDSHRWIDVPHTRYERLRELRVRECRQTAMVIAFRYQNIDTGKYDTDKIQTISSRSLASEMSGSHFNGGYSGSRYSYDDAEESVSFVNDGARRITIPPFVPKDDDFEEEQRRADIDKALAVIERKKKDIAVREAQMEASRKELEYSAYVMKREQELLEEARLNNFQRNLSGNFNVKSNRWIPK